MDPRCFDLPDHLLVARPSRRRLLRGLGAGLAALLAARSLGASAAPPPIAPGPPATPEAIAPGAVDGVAKLRAFYLQGALPVDPRQVEPGKNWRLFANGPLSYLIPPAWSGRSLDALTDPTGVLIDVAGSQFAANDGSAAWETYLALAPGGATPDQAAQLGLRNLLGQRPDDVVLSVERGSLAGAALTFAVARVGAGLAVVRGGAHSSPGSVDALFYEVMAAPEAAFTSVTLGVFLPLIYQKLGGQGGASGNGSGGNGSNGNGGNSSNGNASNGNASGANGNGDGGDGP